MPQVDLNALAGKKDKDKGWLSDKLGRLGTATTDDSASDRRADSKKSTGSDRRADSKCSGGSDRHSMSAAVSALGSAVSSVAYRAAASAEKAANTVGRRTSAMGGELHAAGASNNNSASFNNGQSMVRKKRQLAGAALRKLDSDEAAKERKQKQLTETSLWETIRSTIKYMLFVLVFCIVAFTTRSSSDFWANLAMRSTFVDSPFFFGGVTHEKTLHDVHFVRPTVAPESGSTPRQTVASPSPNPSPSPSQARCQSLASASAERLHALVSACQGASLLRTRLLHS